MSDIRRFPRRYQIDAFSPDDIQKIHDASMVVLETVGFTTNSDMLAKRMADESQKVEFGSGGENHRVYLDPDFVMSKVQMAPRHYTLGARNPENDLPIDGQHMYMSTDGCPAHMLDIDTGERRDSNKKDLSDIAKLADALPQIGLVWQSASASDKIVPVRPMHETHAQFAYTSKHIMQMTAVDPFNARGLLEMLEVIQGSKEAIKEKPIMSNFQCIISPMHWDAPPVEAMEMLAAAGIPVGICSMPMAAATAPATVAGTIMMANAEILSGVAVIETLVPGARTFYVSYASTIDMNSGRMNPCWGGEETWLEMGGPVMARFYDIPTVHSTMGTGSLAHDWTAGAQNMLSAMGSMVFAGDIMTGAGSLNADSIYSLQGLVLDAEIMEMCYQWVKGIEINDETLAVETVQNVGPGGHFLGEAHTMAHMRDFRRSDIMNRMEWEGWTEAGRPTPEDTAKDKAREILATHEVDPLSDDVAGELDRIMNAYEAEALESDEEY